MVYTGQNINDLELMQLAAKKHGSIYGYTPTLWICILFVVLFSVTTVLHLLQTFFFKPRLYWMIPTIVCCGICEIIGWVGRYSSSKNPSSLNAFLIQITTTIIAPTFLTAGFYTILGKMITVLGPRYSRLSPKAYLMTFLTADVIALVVQAVGGAKASLAFQDGKDANPGSHIMLAGIFIQLVGIVIYLTLATEFLLRFHLRKPLRPVDPSHAPSSSESSTVDSMRMEGKETADGRSAMSHRVRLMIAALFLVTTLVLIRSTYRAIELLGGWRGRVITTEKYFNILDGAPIVLSMFLLNLLHPAVLLRT